MSQYHIAPLFQMLILINNKNDNDSHFLDLHSEKYRMQIVLVLCPVGIDLQVQFVADK